MTQHTPEDLQRIYHARFSARAPYRQAIWSVLVERFFQRFVRPEDAVLDLGCGDGLFINQIRCGKKFAMDLNPAAPRSLAPQVQFLFQDCSQPWPLPDASLDLIFTSNFFEHLPDKASLGRTLDQIHRALKSGGRLIAMGPNIKYLPGAYWDFWDHHLPLTELALKEALETRSFNIEKCWPKFLPYAMTRGPRYPLFLLRLYLALPFAWPIFGKQFLLVAKALRQVR